LNVAAAGPEVAACVIEGQRGCPKGKPLVYPAPASQSPVFTEIATRIAANPALARDQEFQNRLAYYRSLDGLAIQTKTKIAAVQKQIDSNQGDREALKAAKQTLENAVKINEADKAGARQSMDERAKTLSIRLDWPAEEAAPPTSAGPRAEQQSARPDATKDDNGKTAGR
jgi:hypothetical protein